MHRNKGEILGGISIFGFSESPTVDVIAHSFCEIIEFRDREMHGFLVANPVFRQRITA